MPELPLIDEKEIEELANEIAELHKKLKEFVEEQLGGSVNLNHVKEEGRYTVHFSVANAGFVEIWPNPLTIEFDYPDKTVYLSASFPFISLEEPAPVHETRPIADELAKIAAWAESANVAAVFKKFVALAKRAEKMKKAVISSQKAIFESIPEAEIIYSGTVEVKRVKPPADTPRAIAETLIYEISYCGKMIETDSLPNETERIIRKLRRSGVPKDEAVRAAKAILDDYTKLHSSMARLGVLMLVR